jgi:hypothetical protein
MEQASLQDQLRLARPIVAGEDPESPDVRLLDPARIRLWRGDTGHLRMELANERCILHVKVACAYPISDTEHYIGFRDLADVDIGMVPDPDRLDPKSRELVREELKKRYFVPKVTHIYEVKEEFGVGYWDVDTDMGRREFIVRGIRDSVREIGASRLIITDVDNNRFEIEDIEALDPVSYRLIEKVL